MTLSARPVPVAVFQADKERIVAVLDDGSVWWTTGGGLEHAAEAWIEAPPIPNTIQAVYQGQSKK